MHIGFTALLAAAALSACTPAIWHADAGSFDFDWQLAGDSVIAPLQVFGDARETWLHFAPGQVLPALFARTQQGEQPIPYQRRDPYVIVDGRWRELVFRGARRVAHARANGYPRAADIEALTMSAPSSRSDAVALDASTLSPVARSVKVNESLTSSSSSSGTSQSAASHTVSIANVADRSVPSGYATAPADSTLRAVLERWARQAGWIFRSEHWAVDVDIPLQGQARFEGEFKHAVRELLSATELADRPLQPCFYVNQVLRVVPLAQACDRSAAAGERV